MPPLESRIKFFQPMLALQSTTKRLLKFSSYAFADLKIPPSENILQKKNRRALCSACARDPPRNHGIRERSLERTVRSIRSSTRTIVLCTYDARAERKFTCKTNGRSTSSVRLRERSPALEGAMKAAMGGACCLELERA